MQSLDAGFLLIKYDLEDFKDYYLDTGISRL